MADQEQAIEKQGKLTVSEEDLRDLCKQWEIPIPILKAAHRSLARGVKGVEIYDVLYVMGQAKLMGLPPMGNWFCLIPATEKQIAKGITGPSVCFKMDAALYLMDHHPRVEPATEEHYWIGGDDTRYEADNPPYFKKAKPTDVLPVVDWDLTCTVSVKLKGEAKLGVEITSGRRISRTLRFRDWARNVDSGGLWSTMPSHMLWKQTCKELVRMHFGGGIWEDEAATVTMDATPTLPAAEERKPKQIGAASPVQSEAKPEPDLFSAISKEEEDRINWLAKQLDMPTSTLIAGLREFLSRGGTAKEFIRETEKSCASAGPAPEPEKPKTIEAPKPLTEAKVDERIDIEREMDIATEERIADSESDAYGDL